MQGLVPGTGHLGLTATGLLAASSASAARPGGFDPASTLGWSVPLLLLAPLFSLVVVLTGVRGRRAASNLTIFTVVVTLAADLLVAWARFRQASPYRVAYQWINVPVSFTGDQRFQGFGVDVAIKLDHYALAAIVSVALLFLACLLWHRAAAPREPGQIRYHVNALLLLLCTFGALVSGDLGELVAFWMVAGVASYLLLTHRWGLEAASRAARVALALPFLGDVALLSAIGLLYSRFGSLNPDKLFPVLHSTPGAGLKSLTVAALLVFASLFVRAGLWPFTSWLTASVGAPPSILALVSGVWPLLAGSLLVRVLPLFNGAGVQAPRASSFALAAAAVAGPLLGLVGTELRRSLLLVTSGGVALALLGILYPGSAVGSPGTAAVGFTAVLAAGLGRCGALLAGSTAALAMRTVDLRQTGGGRLRMPVTSATLLISLLAVALSTCAAVAGRPRSAIWLTVAVPVFLVAAGSFRVGFAVVLGPLRRRRAFEPGRVREAAAPVVGAALVAAVAGLAGAVLAFLTSWVAFIAPGHHDAPSVGTYVLWIVVALAGTAVAAAVMSSRKDAALELAARLGERLATAWAIVGRLYVRFLSRPGLRIVTEVEGVGLPAAESRLGRAASTAGFIAGRTLPWLPVLAVAAVLLAVVFGLASPGVLR